MSRPLLLKSSSQRCWNLMSKSWSRPLVDVGLITTTIIIIIITAITTIATTTATTTIIATSITNFPGCLVLLIHRLSHLLLQVAFLLLSHLSWFHTNLGS